MVAEDSAEQLYSSSSQNSPDDLEIFSQVVAALKQLDPDARIRLLRTLATFFEIPLHSVSRPSATTETSIRTSSGSPSFSEDRTTSPKEFLFDKKPATDSDRVACLAYYLTHYRDTPFFKTLDISKLNTEAAQIKFSNPAQAVDNATKTGLLVPASKGQKQLSAIGELYVQALPDRVAARDSIAHARRKRGRPKSKRSAGVVDGPVEE